MRIAVDVDGVLLKTHELFVKKFNSDYGTSHTINDITSWNIWECFKCEKEEVMNTFNELAYMDWRNLPAYGLAGFYMLTMNKVDEVDILTNRIPNTLEKTIEKLSNVFVKKGMQYNNFIDTDNKIKTEYDYDLFIDDNPNMIETLKSNQKLILFNQPWNKGVYGINVYKANNWNEVFEKYIKIKQTLKNTRTK